MFADGTVALPSCVRVMVGVPSRAIASVKVALTVTVSPDLAGRDSELAKLVASRA